MRKFKDKEEVLDFLNSIPFGSVIDIAADAIMDAQNASARKITITQEQFSKFFRILGTTATGEVETRGRKKREDGEDLFET